MATFVAALAPRAEAQQAPQGFAVERFYPSAPGSGWLVMEDLAMHGGLGGAVSLSGGYSRNPLRVTDGVNRLSVVSDQAFYDIGLAATYDRFRLYLNFDSPIVVQGESGTVGRYPFAAPGVDVGENPDTVSDVRFGFDARLLGEATGPLRLGAGAQLYVPSANRSDYLTDGTYRAMGRLLFAGDASWLTLAGHLGAHVRPLNEGPAPGSPQGPEMLFGIAAGGRFRLDDAGGTVVVGPELFGETAWGSFLNKSATGIEGLITGRIDGGGASGPHLQLKLGAGGGINAHFGAPEARGVIAISIVDPSITKGRPETPAPPTSTASPCPP